MHQSFFMHFQQGDRFGLGGDRPEGGAWLFVFWSCYSVSVRCALNKLMEFIVKGKNSLSIYSVICPE